MLYKLLIFKIAKKKKITDDSDEESQPKKTKSRKKIGASSDDDSFKIEDDSDGPAETHKSAPSRPGRGAAKTKYTFDDSDSDF